MSYKENKKIDLNTKEVLTLDEASKYTGMSKSYLYKLTGSMRIPHFKPTGKMVFFDRSELINWLKNNRVATMAEISSKAMGWESAK